MFCRVVTPGWQQGAHLLDFLLLLQPEEPKLLILLLLGHRDVLPCWRVHA